MLTLQRTDDTYIVYQNECRIGSLRLYDNPHHMHNCYVKLKLDELDTEISAELFKELRKIAGRPLQVMVDSDDAELIAFLLAGGFVCRRKCNEVEADIKDYIGGQADAPLEHFRIGEPNYEKACRMLFAHYAETHKAVNPWTADYETFCDALPEDMIYSKQGAEIVSVAFVEENEIAYVCGVDKNSFAEFARSLVCTMLEKYETICFESDDCDWAAMLLKSLFKNQEETSYDTYVYDNKGTISR